MTSFMIIVVIALFIVLVGFTWYRLEAFEGMERIILCVAGILISWGITSIVYSISSNGINYTDAAVQHEISRILVLVFTPINGIAFMPILGRILSQAKFEEITIQEAAKRVIILALVLLVILFVEVKYLQNIQLGIFDIANGIGK